MQLSFAALCSTRNGCESTGGSARHCLLFLAIMGTNGRVSCRIVLSSILGASLVPCTQESLEMGPHTSQRLPHRFEKLLRSSLVVEDEVIFLMTISSMLSVPTIPRFLIPQQATYRARRSWAADAIWGLWVWFRPWLCMMLRGLL
ncbi:hypothetical protein DL93DRAFT_95367 [Clavulina sp. PMI_390]|nr:hypothetical protein DL93DRAFT_95367 [Clavulina sp. PMI_390]